MAGKVFADGNCGFIPDEEALLPCQFFNTAATCGETALAVAVLEEAIHDFMKGTLHITDTNRENYDDAVRWLFNTRATGYLYDFEHICFLLDVVPKTVRANLKKWAVSTSSIDNPIGHRKAHSKPKTHCA